ncbi:MAG: TetR/AcrR family transcriptional regulator [Anaerolinea sp.]|nr:TetR/AcrR family transcriptional regulator [Anaerolinea sp.]
MDDSPQSKGERTRQVILSAAREIILSQGYTAASMRKISEAAGITPAAIYNHFSSKEDLFSALLEEAVPLQELAAFLNEVTAATPEALLSQVFRGILALLRQHEDYIRLALIDAQERDGATLTTFVPRLFPLMMQLMQKLHEVDGDNGRLRSIPPFILVRSLISLVAGYLLTERIGRPEQTLGLPPLDWEGGLLDIFMHGIFVHESGVESRES